jgi:hypothetical protein
MKSKAATAARDFIDDILPRYTDLAFVFMARSQAGLREFLYTPFLSRPKCDSSP